MSEVLAAARALRERKMALNHGDATAYVDLRLLAVGLDVEINDMLKVATGMAVNACRLVAERGMDPIDAFRAVWLDGALTLAMRDDMRGREVAGDGGG